MHWLYYVLLGAAVLVLLNVFFVLFVVFTVRKNESLRTRTHEQLDESPGPEGASAAARTPGASR